MLRLSTLNRQLLTNSSQRSIPNQSEKRKDDVEFMAALDFFD